ncbi:MAG: hypothetical protein JSU86_05540, partial [Phycisphaerales bacterium]
MRTTFAGLALLCLIAQVAGCDPEQANSPRLRGPYLGQEPPGLTAELFAPGVISRKYDELNSVFSPDGRQFLFSIKLPIEVRHTMFSMNLVD